MKRAFFLIMVIGIGFAIATAPAIAQEKMIPAQPPCEVIGMRLIAATYSPLTGIARTAYVHDIGGVVYAEGFGRASLSLTQHQARLEAYRRARAHACSVLKERLQRRRMAEK